MFSCNTGSPWNMFQSFRAFYGFLQGSFNNTTNCKKIPHKSTTKKKFSQIFYFTSEVDLIFLAKNGIFSASCHFFGNKYLEWNET